MNSSRWLVPSLVAVGLAFISMPASAQVSISVGIAPPPLIVDDQPPAPDDGYLWTPGYWAYDDDQGEYYWVPGSWEQPPEVGLYWTPNYWGWADGAYVYYPGYWGPTVGFYGGVNYGYGYWGHGYGGGRWDNGHFAYNTAANNFGGRHFNNVYTDRSLYRAQSNRVSFNGGRGGLQAQPTNAEREAMHQNHVQATAAQESHVQTAAQTRSHQVKVDKNKAAGNAGPGPGGEMRKEKTDASSTGNAGTPAHHETQVSNENQIKSEEKTTHVKKNVEHQTESHESHMHQGPGGGEVKHEKSVQPHPQAEHHADAPKPQGKPEAKSGGGGNKDKH